ncbi:MAG: hypothetical protein K0B05_10850 [Bacteroidales bacterium]|nr:hypothetical protein [Bacteroidales bacterium]
MKTLMTLFAAFAILASCNDSRSRKMEYPVTMKGNVVDTIFGTIVPDPFRWMEDDRYLVVTAAVSTTGNELYIKDLTNKSQDFRVVVGNFDKDHYVIDNEGSTLFIFTNLDAPNSRIVTVDAENPGIAGWKDFIPETENTLSASTGSGYFFANYLVDAITSIKQYDKTGTLVREIELPGIGTASGFSGYKDDKDLYFMFTNYTTPSTIYKTDPHTGVTSVFKKPELPFSGDDYESTQVFYASGDGTRVPMIITHRKGTPLNGKNPAILYGYGGFSISETPSFSVAMAQWLRSTLQSGEARTEAFLSEQL